MEINLRGTKSPPIDFVFYFYEIYFMSLNKEDLLHIERSLGYFDSVLVSRLLEIKEGLSYQETWLGNLSLDDYLRKGYFIVDMRYHTLNNCLITDIVLRKKDKC